jgi:hypothetical protein
MQNDVLGTVKVPRSKVARITLGDVTNTVPTAVATANAFARPLVPLFKANSNVVQQVEQQYPRSIRVTNSNDSNVVQQIEQQYLADASPEAKAKFNELASGLMTGRLGVNDIRAQAKTAADQLRKFKAELGSDAGEELDGYLAILESFLNETKSSAETTPNKPAAGSKPKAKADADDKGE